MKPTISKYLFKDFDELRFRGNAVQYSEGALRFAEVSGEQLDDCLICPAFNWWNDHRDRVCAILEQADFVFVGVRFYLYRYLHKQESREANSRH